MNDPPLVAWFVVEVDIDEDRENALYTAITGPFPTEDKAVHEKEEQKIAWERALAEWDDGNPYNFKGWQVVRKLIRDFQVDKLERQDEESHRIMQEAAGAVGASLLADEGIGPLAGDGND